jgi:hypothetical protein
MITVANKLLRFQSFAVCSEITLKTEATGTPKRWFLSTKLHGITSLSSVYMDRPIRLFYNAVSSAEFTVYSSAVQRFYILGRIWLMAVETRAPCGDCNNNTNNNNNNNNKVILIQITTDSIFMTVFSEIFWNSHEINCICKPKSAREGELSEDRFMTRR